MHETEHASLDIQLLGQFHLRYNATAVAGPTTSSHQALLAYLVLHADQVHTRRHLAFLLWPDSSEPQARTNLRKAIYHLRHTLPELDRFLVADRHSLMWRSDAPYTLDVSAFETAVTRAQSSANPVHRIDHLAHTIKLYRGDLLPGHYDTWILKRREMLRQRYLACLILHIQLLEEMRDYTTAVATAQRLLREDPLHETTYRHLMRLQALSGDRAGALHTYHTCVTTLRRDLGVAPSSATQEAYRALLALRKLPQGPPPTRIPLVGRRNAWIALQDAWQRATRQQPRLLTLQGEAGIGKTRLAEELLDWTARQGITTLSAACYPGADDLPFTPVATWLRAATQNKPLDALPDRWLREVSRLLPELAATRPDLAAPGPITENWQWHHFFAALAGTLLHQPQPMLLFIDDLQWCDRETLSWLRFLLAFDPQARFLIVGAVRSAEVPPSHPLHALRHDLQRHGSLVDVTLNRLDAAEAATLARHVTGQTLDTAQAAQLFSETEGVPLFIVEIARDGLAPATDGAGGPRPREPAESSPALPGKVLAVIESRLDNLSPEARQLAELAATIGRSFAFDLLRRAGTTREMALVRALDELWQHSIVREAGADAYDFSHDKIRQVVYDRLSPARRTLLHSRVVTALESQRDAGLEVDPSRLGAHYAALHRYAAALACYRQAATAAQHIFAQADALAHLDRALELADAAAPDAATVMHLHEQRGDVLALVGKVEAARDAFATAAAHAGQPVDRARLLCKTGNTWMAQQRHTQAADAYGRGLQLLGPEPAGDVPVGWWQTWMDIQLQRAAAMYFAGQLAALETLIAQLKEPVRYQGSPQQQRRLLDAENMLIFRQKRYRLDAADVDRLRDALVLAQQSGDVNQLSSGRFALGFACLWAGELGEAAEMLSVALDDAAEAGNLYLQEQCLAYLTVARRVQGDEPAVQALVARHRAIATQTGNPFYRGVLASNEAWLGCRVGAWATAVAQAESALADWSSMPYPFRWLACWPLLAAALAQDDLARATDCAAQLRDPLQQVLPDAISPLLAEAIASWQAGDTAVCRTRLDTAVQLARANHTF